MDPFGGNQQIAINSPGCSSGWRIVPASPVPSAQRITTGTGHFGHSVRTKMDTGPMKDNIFGSEAFILLTEMEMHYTGATNFKISFKIWLLMHMTAYTGEVPWPSSATARGLGLGGGGDDKLAIDTGGNLPEKVENH